MVTAELPETEVAQPETQVVETTEAPAEPPSSTEAQGTEQAAPIDHGALLDEFAKEQGYSTETAEAQDAQGAVDPEAIRQEERAKFEQQMRDAGVAVNFRNRIDAIHNFLTQRGLTPEDAQRVANEFNNHHAQSAPVHFQGWSSNLNSAAAQTLLPEKERQAWLTDVATAKNAEEHVAKIATAARKGYVTEAERDKAVKAAEGSAMAKYKAFLEKKGVKIGGSVTPPADSGGAATKTFASRYDLDRAFNNGDISRTEYGREKARFEGTK